jgi:hypothetical protein
MPSISSAAIVIVAADCIMAFIQVLAAARLQRW